MERRYTYLEQVLRLKLKNNILFQAVPRAYSQENVIIFLDQLYNLYKLFSLASSDFL